jgi:hypothetical protein
MLKKTKLIQLLDTLTADEFTDLGKFINSPFHNESPKMRMMYSFLKKYYPAFDHTGCTKENIFRVLYPESKKYDDTKLRERFSDMLRLAEDYLSFLHIKKNLVNYKRQALLEFSERRLDVHFDKKNKEITAILDKTTAKDVNYFLDVYNNNAALNAFYANRKLLGKRKEGYDEFVKEVWHFLRYVSSQMTNYYVTMYNWKDILNYEFSYELYKPVMKFIEENNLTSYPLIKAQYQILKIMENEDDDSLYYELKKTYIEDMEHLAERDRIRTGTLLINDALRRFMLGKKDFNAERFEIMKLQLENEIYQIEDGWLSRELYFTYVLTSISLGDIKWAEEFISNYTFKVAPNIRKHAYLYVKGLICFHKKEYENALEELSGIKGGDFTYFVNIKSLYAKIYFEMGDYEKVLSVLDSFKHYLSSNPLIPKFTRIRYTNYIRIMNKLTILKFDKDEFNVVKLISEIKGYSTNDITTSKEWLLEKAMELQKTKT